MVNFYEVAEVIEIGKAQDVILGTSKLIQNVDDSPNAGYREFELEDDE